MSVPFRRASAIPLYKGVPIQMQEMAGMNVLEAWFASRNWTPFAFQREVWDAYRSGESGLVHAATGTGKTLAAWGGRAVIVPYVAGRSTTRLIEEVVARAG